MQATDLSKWVKPVVLILNTNLTLDNSQTCAAQGKLGGTLDGITGSDAACAS